MTYAGSPLITNRLLLLHPAEGMDTHTSRRVHPAPRLLRWLLQGEDVALGVGAVRLETGRKPFIPGMAHNRLAQITGSLGTRITCAIVGGTIGMREGVAMEVARRAGRPLVRIDVERAKPWPDLFLSAVAALGAEPANAVAFEDSHHGARAAVDAGLFCVVAPNPITRTQDHSHAHLVVGSLAEVTLADLDRLMLARY